jgi:excisionase family DNA binding protein
MVWVMDDQYYYSTGKAAQELGASQDTVRALCNSGVIRAVPTNGRQWRIPAREVERLKREGLAPVPRPMPGDGAVTRNASARQGMNGYHDGDADPHRAAGKEPEVVRAYAGAAWGKTENAPRRIPMTDRVKAVVEMRRMKSAGSGWLFPAATSSGHIEPSSLKKQHAKAIAAATRLLRKETGSETATFQGFDLYTLRHTCLTRWAPYMDPFTLMYLAGHSDMRTTKRYVHPQEKPTREAMDRARQATEQAAQDALERARTARRNGDGVLSKGLRPRDSFGDSGEGRRTSKRVGVAAIQ